MNKNPTLSAVSAAVYIVIITSLLYYAPHSMDKTPSVLIPIGMVSLLVLSVGIMIYLFLLTPFRMYLDGDKQGGVTWFMKTLGSFAVVTLFAVLAMVLRGSMSA